MQLNEFEIKVISALIKDDPEEKLILAQLDGAIVKSRECTSSNKSGQMAA